MSRWHDCIGGSVTPQDLDALLLLRQRLDSGLARALREQAGLRRSEVAATLGITYQRLQKWELGIRNPSGPVALRYARLLDRLAARQGTP